MSRWFRFYDDVINDPKILSLPEVTRWAWVAVLCIASKNDGRLPAIEHVALLLRTTKQRAAATIAGLHNAGLLDKDETGFAPHNWSGRQYKSDVSNDRVKRYRQRQRNDECNVTVTPPETEAETKPEADSEKRESARTREAVAPREERPKPLHVDWHPSQRDVEAAHDAGLTDDDIDQLAKRFGPYYRSRGEVRADWHEQWKSWCLDEGAKKPKAIPDEPAKPVDFDKAVQFFKKTGKWWKGIGPEPGSSGCQVPRDLLEKHQLAS